MRSGSEWFCHWIIRLRSCDKRFEWLDFRQLGVRIPQTSNHFRVIGKNLCKQLLLFSICHSITSFFFRKLDFFCFSSFETSIYQTLIYGLKKCLLDLATLKRLTREHKQLKTVTLQMMLVRNSVKLVLSFFFWSLDPNR